MKNMINIYEDNDKTLRKLDAAKIEE